MRRKTVVRVPDEVQYYDWRIARWYGSETRERLDATGRGIYRELLDQCYAQGEFPDDPAWISRKCACSVRDYQKVWPLIERHFPKNRSHVGYRYNVFARMWRKSYFALCETNRKNGKTGGVKSSKHADLESGRLADGERAPTDRSSLSKGRKEGKEESKGTEEKKAPPLPDDGTVPLNGGGQFYDDRQAAWEWAFGIYPGEIKPEWDAEIFVSCVQTFEDIASMRANLPLWIETPKWQEGFAPTFENFLKKRQFSSAPRVSPVVKSKAEQRSEQRREDWASL